MGNFSIDEHLHDDDRNTGWSELGNHADEAGTSVGRGLFRSRYLRYPDKSGKMTLSRKSSRKCPMMLAIRSRNFK